ncbi:aldehyde dehydrogenase family protein [Paludisphaera mucosa]|uniref:Aldehyde dehydrogenase family protein n=1 Tax=Paludisphaera mucosa TaxID=3030827 RepID=A0ABT6F6F0_9BACT|nr:aldehyde dehydrogenase family protein [Paludisphaera mucosa]MDG3003140.1 aldehyde dehydrogenase family protein [Paludisphaera mucosa]
MATALDESLITRNPATGAEIGRVAATSPDAVAAVVERSTRAQASWAEAPWRERRALVDRWRRILSRDAREWAELIRDEIGKPAVEAMAGDVIPTLDALRWTVKNGGAALADERLGPSWQRFLLTPTGRLRWRPLGVVGMIGTWNYPLFLNAGPMAQALAAGCGVVWKPSELAIASAARLQASLLEAGTPEGLVGIVQGGGDVGRALLESPIAKMVFTGGVETGRRALETVAARGVSAVIELSGFDPAVVLPGADVESTARSLLWAAFVGCGQTCVAVKRILVVGDPAPLARALAEATGRLRVGDPARPGIDVGPMIHDQARSRLDRTIRATVEAGAEILAGGRPIEGPGCFYAPTLLMARSPEPERVLEGAFGPVLLIRGFADVDRAVEAANASRMALAASVWGADRKAARAVAERIVAGMVCVNEAVTPTASAAAPFGGFKASGFGRTHGLLGLREFVAPQVVFERRAGGFRPQLFPYKPSGVVDGYLEFYRRLFHPRA